MAQSLPWFCAETDKVVYLSSHTLHIHDIVIINDLLNVLHYPVIGRIKGIDNDSQGTPHWYTVEYKHLKINPKAKQASERILSGENFFTVRRPLQSLLLLSPHSSDNNQVTTDILDSVPGIIREDGKMIKKKIRVKVELGDDSLIQDDRKK